MGVGISDGSWNGAFYGAAGQIDHDTDTDTPAINTPPPGVAGEFDANFTNGAVAGAYGAETEVEQTKPGQAPFRGEPDDVARVSFVSRVAPTAPPSFCVPSMIDSLEVRRA